MKHCECGGEVFIKSSEHFFTQCQECGKIVELKERDLFKAISEWNNTRQEGTMLKEIRQLDFYLEDINKMVDKLVDELQNNRCEDESRASEALGRLVLARRNMYAARDILTENYNKGREKDAD